MKILHICQYYNDGYGYQENLLPRYQQKLGHEVLVVTSDRTSHFSASKKSQKVNTGISKDFGVSVLRLPISGQFKARFVFFKGLKEILEQEKPNYIFHHGLASPSLITCAKYKRDNPSVFLAADNHSDLNISARNHLWGISYYKILWTNLLKQWLPFIDVVFGVTPARCYFAEEYHGIPRDKIRLLPIGADTDAVNNLVAGGCKEESSRLQLATGGKWAKKKGLEKLLQAVEGLELHLQIFGSIEDIEIERKIESKQNVSFLGWKNREETLKTLAGANIALWPGQHTTLMEDAIATATPMLLRYHGSTSHHLRGNGLYFFSDNPLEIRQMVQVIMNNPEILRQMKNRAVKQRKILSYDQVADDSLAYFYERAPQLIHQTFMNDPLCNPTNKDFHKIGR